MGVTPEYEGFIYPSPEDKPEVIYLIEGYAPAVVCAVNGFYIRNHIYIDFTEGGNDQVYGGGPGSEANFIDQGLIYLDDDVNAIEKMFVLLHELHERNKMKNEAMSYDDAHASANKVEQMARDNSELVDGLIEIELQDWR